MPTSTPRRPPARRQRSLRVHGPRAKGPGVRAELRQGDRHERQQEPDERPGAGVRNRSLGAPAGAPARRRAHPRRSHLRRRWPRACRRPACLAGDRSSARRATRRGGRRGGRPAVARLARAPARKRSAAAGSRMPLAKAAAMPSTSQSADPRGSRCRRARARRGRGTKRRAPTPAGSPRCTEAIRRTPRATASNRARAPIAPSSAATVRGVVCDTDVGVGRSRLDSLRLARGWPPIPTPTSGFRSITRAVSSTRSMRSLVT